MTPNTFAVETTVLSTETYLINVTDVSFLLTSLHFSMVIFDQADIAASYLYYL